MDNQITSTTKLPASYKTNPSVQKAISEYGEEFVAEVLYKYPMLNRTEVVPSLSSAVAMDAPTLVHTKLKYSERHTLFWLKRQLIEVFQFCGCFKSMDEYQVRQCASLILNDELFCTVTLPEFMQFCDRFKKAKYTTFFNTANPNPQDFFKAFQAFFRDLQEARGRHFDEQRKKREEEEQKNAKTLSPEEFKKYQERIKQILSGFSTKP